MKARAAGTTGMNTPHARLAEVLDPPDPVLALLSASGLFGRFPKPSACVINRTRISLPPDYSMTMNVLACFPIYAIIT